MWLFSLLPHFGILGYSSSSVICSDCLLENVLFNGYLNHKQSYFHIFIVCFSSSWQNYVTCALGIHFVGFVMMCSGAVDSLCSIIFGRLSRYTGRPVLLSLGIVTYIASLLIVVFMIVLFRLLSPSVTFPGVTHNINVCHYPCLMPMILILSKTDPKVGCQLGCPLLWHPVNSTTIAICLSCTLAAYMTSS